MGSPSLTVSCIFRNAWRLQRSNSLGSSVQRGGGETIHWSPSLMTRCPSFDYMMSLINKCVRLLTVSVCSALYMHHCSLSMMALHMGEMLVMVSLVSLLNLIYYTTIVPVITHASSHMFSMWSHPMLVAIYYQKTLAMLLYPESLLKMIPGPLPILGLHPHPGGLHPHLVPRSVRLALSDSFHQVEACTRMRKVPQSWWPGNLLPTPSFLSTMEMIVTA